MREIDFKKLLKVFYCAPKEPTLVDVPPLAYLMIDGRGDPNGSAEFTAATEALFSVSYTLKFSLKKARVADWTIPGLEGLWWVDPPDCFSLDRRDLWRWTLMILQPEEVTPGHLEAALAAVGGRRKGSPPPALRLETLHEGRSAQVLHVGSYADEPATIARLHAFIAAQGLSFRGRHHEIYLSDPRRCSPEKLKTIIRQPVG
jgi:hypothetical protein